MHGAEKPAIGDLVFDTEEEEVDGADVEMNEDALDAEVADEAKMTTEDTGELPHRKQAEISPVYTHF